MIVSPALKNIYSSVKVSMLVTSAATPHTECVCVCVLTYLVEDIYGWH